MESDAVGEGAAFAAAARCRFRIAYGETLVGAPCSDHAEPGKMATSLPSARFVAATPEVGSTRHWPASKAASNTLRTRRHGLVRSTGGQAISMLVDIRLPFLVRAAFPDLHVLICIHPPDRSVLERRFGPCRLHPGIHTDPGGIAGRVLRRPGRRELLALLFGEQGPDLIHGLVADGQG